MKDLLTRVSAIALASLALGSAAQAQACDSTTPSNGDTVSCAGNGTGVDFSGIDDLNVTVTGSIVEPTGDGFLAGAGLTLLNSGLMETQGDDVSLLEAGAGSDVTNSGTMTVSTTDYSKGLVLGSDSSFENTASGTVIGGGSKAVGGVLDMGDNATVTNAGTLQAIGGQYVGVLLGANSTLTNTGVIDAENAAIGVGAASTIINSGTIKTYYAPASMISSTGDLTLINTATGAIEVETYGNGISASGDLTLLNDGLINTPGMIGISSGGDAYVRNSRSGAIIAQSGNSTGLQIAGRLDLVNDGLIQNTQGFTIVANGDDSVIVNNGTIRKTTPSNFTAIFTPGSSEIVNSGLIEASSTMSAVLLSGTSRVTNSGTIKNLNESTGSAIAQMSANAIQVDNAGLIEGFTAISLGGGADIVTNSGTIIGTGGRAINFAAGDDTLVLSSLDIQGDVIFGTGNDTLIVNADASAGMLTFGSDLENVTLNAPLAIYTDNTLVVADASFFNGLDMIRAGAARSLGRMVTSLPEGEGWWAATGMDAGSSDDSKSSLGQIAIGRDFGSFGVFLTANRAGAQAHDGMHEMASDSLQAGVSGAFSLGRGLSLSGALFAGTAEATFSDVDGGLELGAAGERVIGISTELSSLAASGLGLAARAGVARHQVDEFSLSSLAGASFAGRSLTTSYLELEASTQVELGRGISLRPYLGASVLQAKGDAMTMSFMGESVSADGSARETELTLGADFSAAEVWSARLETRFGEDGDMAGGVRFGMRF